MKISEPTFLDYRKFYYEIVYIYTHWSPKMKRAFGCTKAHVKSVMTKFEIYK